MNIIEDEIELGEEHVEQLDKIYGSIHEICKIMTKNENLDYDMNYIGEIADSITDTLTAHGYDVYYPSVVTKEDGSQFIEECIKGRTKLEKDINRLPG